MTRSIKVAATPALDLPLTPTLLGDAVRARRTQSGLTLPDAAALCGVAKDTLMKVEHGVPTVRMDSVLQICSSLGITLHIVSWQNKMDAADEWY